jgi:hypothetical protein
MTEYTLIVQYWDDPEVLEATLAKDDAFAKANSLDLSAIVWAELSEPDGTVVWDHISGEVL